MSKWAYYQLLIVVLFGAFIIMNNVFREQIADLFSFVNSFIEPSILLVFFSVVLVIWGFSIVLLLQEKKGKPLFIHKIWRIMPAIIGVLLLLSVVVFLILGVTVLSDVSMDMQWLLDLSIVYFLVVFYLFILSIVIRYGKVNSDTGMITVAANVSILILLVIILFLPTV